MRHTWWIITPILLWPLARDLILYWRFVVWAQNLHYIMLEVKPPPDVIRTPKAMDLVFAGLHGAWTTIKIQDKVVRGEQRQPRFSLEMVGIDGRMHFYIRCQRKYRNFVEAQVYSQYPEAEIYEVEDYVKNVPRDAPNKEWEVWGTEMEPEKPSGYPIRLFEEFEDTEEERRVDPLSAFAEVISKLRPGEQIWTQIIIEPVLAWEWIGDAQKIIDKMMGRISEQKQKGFFETIGEMTTKGIDLMLKGTPPEWKEKALAEDQFSFLRMSPHERLIIEAISRKMSKPAFRSMVRTLYVARRDVYDGTIISGVQGAFRQFTDQNMNGLKIKSETKPSSHILVWFPRMRNWRRRIRQMRLYRDRSYNFMYGSEDYILVTEELATLFHFPGRVVTAPSLERVATRPGGPPVGLPTE